MKKIIASIVCLIMGVSAIGTLGGCNKPSIKIDKTKTQLYVTFYNGGYGSEWINKLARRFEQAEKDNSYETGKTGVEVILDPLAVGVSATNLRTGNGDVFFSEGMSTIQDIMSQGLLLSITDIVEENLKDKFGEDKTIESKLREEQIPLLMANYKQTGNKYYAVPHSADYNGIVYDIALFEENNLYYKDDGGFISSAQDVKSAGPDAIKNTYDDGLPATYDEFFALCDSMVRKGITPFTWNGTYHDWYFENVFMQGLVADYEGKDQMMLNYTFNGTAKNLVSGFDGGGKPIIRDSVPITNATGYELSSQAGMYYSLSFLERLVKNETYYDPTLCLSTSYSHTEAQSDFLYSSFVSSKAPIAMLIDGTYWEEEASSFGVFKSMESRHRGAGRMDRKFGFLPLPKATDQQVFEGNKLTLYSAQFSMAFISANVPEWRQPLAKKFLQFSYTDQSLKEFTLTTNALKSLNYSLNQTEKGQLSHYGRSLQNLVENPNVEIAYSSSSNVMFLDNIDAFAGNSRYSSSVGNAVKLHPVSAIKSDSITAKDYFLGLKKYNESRWSVSYSKYFN